MPSRARALMCFSKGTEEVYFFFFLLVFFFAFFAFLAISPSVSPIVEFNAVDIDMHKYKVHHIF
jgi:hypothetical protein